MRLNKILFIILSLFVWGCTPTTILQQEQIDKAALMTGSKPPSIEDYNLAIQKLTNDGDKLRDNINISTQRYRKGLGQSKDRLVIYGAIATATGAITATLVSAYVPTDTKVGVGAAGAIIAAVIGVYQIIDGAGKDKESYVKSCDLALAHWSENKPELPVAPNKKQLEDIYDATKKALKDFKTDAKDIQSNFTEYANFVIP